MVEAKNMPMLVQVQPAKAKGEYVAWVRGQGYADCTIHASGIASARAVLADWIFNELEGRELFDEP
jgi:hypothetical protein